jgi:hypothetical protein
MLEERSTRRDFIKRGVYVAPAILTLVALPSFASAGSGQNRCGHWETHDGWHGFWFWRHEVHSRSFHRTDCS